MHQQQALEGRNAACPCPRLVASPQLTASPQQGAAPLTGSASSRLRPWLEKALIFSSRSSHLKRSCKLRCVCVCVGGISCMGP